MKRNYSAKMRRLRQILRETGGLVVAFSGGLDSAFLAAVAKQELGRRVVAVTKFSPLQSMREQEEARAVAKQLGLRHIIIKSDDLLIPQVARNDELRCYFCKKALFGKLKKIADRSGFKQVADGSNVDDLKDVRPGRRAVEEYGVLCPLLEAGFDKVAIHAISRQMGLPTAGKKSESCLATRIPFGERVTRGKLNAIESVENGLHRLGFREVRARHHGAVVRLEVGPSEIGRLLLPRLRKKIIALGRQSGFKFVGADLEGYRRGSMNG